MINVLIRCKANKIILKKHFLWDVSKWSSTIDETVYMQKNRSKGKSTIFSFSNESNLKSFPVWENLINSWFE